MLFITHSNHLEMTICRLVHFILHIVWTWNMFHCIDSHVFHGFPVIGCLQNDQQQTTPDQIQKDLHVLYVLQDFHFRARFPYLRQYLQMHCFEAKYGAALNHRLGKEQCPSPPSWKKTAWVSGCRDECVNLKFFFARLSHNLPYILRTPETCVVLLSLETQQGLGSRCGGRRGKVIGLKPPGRTDLTLGEDVFFLYEPLLLVRFIM